MADVTGSRARAALMLALAVAVTLSGCTSSTQVGTGATSGTAVTAAPASGATGQQMHFDLTQVRGELASVPVRPVAPYAGYDRVADFGEAWLDVDHNGCDTRSDILRRDLVGASLAGACKVDTGTLRDPYTGATVHYVRGPQSSEAVQIDHVVPVYEAWRTGAQQWSQQKRIQFANDPLNLLAVAGDTNQAKGDLDPSRWLPPLPSYRCEYVERYVTVVAKYGLFVTSREKPAISRVLDGCRS